MATGPYVELLGIVAESYRAYARCWGWDLVLSTEEHLADGRPAPWGKVRLVRDLLDDYDWVMWIDADAGFVHTDADVMEEVTPGHDLYVADRAKLDVQAERIRSPASAFAHPAVRSGRVCVEPLVTPAFGRVWARPAGDHPRVA
jgi:hypothetical protein